jgi:hypothetical protein
METDCSMPVAGKRFQFFSLSFPQFKKWANIETNVKSVFFSWKQLKTHQFPGHVVLFMSFRQFNNMSSSIVQACYPACSLLP